ncbi:hydroquinone glucosyltransferase [Vigna unguiculata]|uniref:Hydroquinone glucosyltransferase n=2 Tax=Vigna unguiculata TaxID=3917 RepID=A0A4D6KYS1_VIGUN|nr:hydroquinone glucosyltransferase [Vigna unguiculata]
MARNEERLHIVMFPWLAFGHMIPNLELAKLIAEKGHHVSFVSTPRNIERLPKVSPNLATLINFVKLPLPKVPNLPENAEATTDVPYDVVQYLKKAYDALEEPFTRFLESSNADWLFYDFIPFWAASVASKLGIGTVFFSIYTVPLMTFMGPAMFLTGAEPSPRTKLEDYTVPPLWIPFPTTVAFRYYEVVKIADSLSDNESGVADTYRLGRTIQNCDFVAIRGCTRFERQWFQVLEDIYQKPVIPVGQLPNTVSKEGEEKDTWQWMIDWLDKQVEGTVVYVAFGSEAKPSQEEVTEIGLGLEKSKLPFLWVLKLQRGPCDPEVLRLPEGFEERTRGRGVVCSTWVPQLKILGHVAVGGFLTHSGWSSVVEAVQNEKPMVLLTFLADQGINARVLEEKKMGYSVPRDEHDGSFTSDSVAHSLRLVMFEEEGRPYRENIKDVKDLFVNTENQERYIENLLNLLSERRAPNLMA